MKGSKKKREKCPYCYGSGENPDMFVAQRECIMCDGTGWLDLTPSDVEKVVDRAVRRTQ